MERNGCDPAPYDHNPVRTARISVGTQSGCGARDHRSLTFGLRPIGASLQTLVGGNISLLTNLCEKDREDAFELMLGHASQLGANAVVGVRYDATEIMQGVTEVLAYGTAVIVEQKRS